MSEDFIVSLVSYGVVGLGGLLAYFSYSLLRQEQANERARPQVLSSIKIYLAFSFALCLAGLASEYLKSGEENSEKLILQLESNKKQTEALNEKLNRAQSKLHQTQVVINSLLNVKQGTLRDIEEIANQVPEKSESLKKLRGTLERIDEQIVETLKNLQ